MVEITNWNEVVAILIALISFLVAWWQNRQKKDIVAFYDPQTVTNNNPVMQQLPARSWKMSDETKNWLLVGESDADQRSILGQISQAEANQEVEYQITYSRGGYSISYGLIKASWRS